MKTRIYIAGKISGTTDYIKRFAAAEKRLTDEGYTVINPASINDYRPNATYSDYLRLGVELLLTCEEIYMLNGWEDSKGAKIEYDIAKAVGIKIRYEGAAKKYYPSEEQMRNGYLKLNADDKIAADFDKKREE